MKKFRQKQFTIKEGHYTGPKDQEKLPGLFETVAKSALLGTGVGAVVGGIGSNWDDKMSYRDGAITGAKYGAGTGIVLKLLLNYFHKPMNKVKYQDVDKNIRREFGIYRLAGITAGDSLDRRASVEEKFMFNDRNVTNYKINFAIQDNKVTMYTYNLTDEELDKVDHSLDYYCKKYYGMEYTATSINTQINSYAVNIVFTNIQVIVNFIKELGEVLNVKINLLDSNAVIKNRLSEDQKSFSVSPLNKYDLLKAISKSGVSPIDPKRLRPKKFGSIASSVVMNIISNSMKNITNRELQNSGVKMPRETFGNPYLEDTLKRLHYIEGFNYTTGNKNVKNNISLSSGILLVTVEKDSNDMKELDKKFTHPGIKRTIMDKVVLYSYSIQSRSEFDLIIKKLMSSGLTFNIFE